MLQCIKERIVLSKIDYFYKTVLGFICNFQPHSETHALCSPLTARMLATSRRTNVTKERSIQSQERAYRKCNDTNIQTIGKLYLIPNRLYYFNIYCENKSYIIYILRHKSI